MSKHSRVWFFVLKVISIVDLEGEGPVEVVDFVGNFDSPESAEKWMRENGKEWREDLEEEFSRFQLTRNKINDPDQDFHLAFYDEDGDQVQYGWKKI